MKGQVKRYTPDFRMTMSHMATLMRENPNGSYVLYEDYKKLEETLNEIVFVEEINHD